MEINQTNILLFPSPYIQSLPLSTLFSTPFHTLHTHSLSLSYTHSLPSIPSVEQNKSPNRPRTITSR